MKAEANEHFMELVADLWKSSFGLQKIRALNLPHVWQRMCIPAMIACEGSDISETLGLAGTGAPGAWEDVIDNSSVDVSATLECAKIKINYAS